MFHTRSQLRECVNDVPLVVVHQPPRSFSEQTSTQGMNQASSSEGSGAYSRAASVHAQLRGPSQEGLPALHANVNDHPLRQHPYLSATNVSTQSQRQCHIRQVSGILPSPIYPYTCEIHIRQTTRLGGLHRVSDPPSTLLEPKRRLELSGK